MARWFTCQQTVTHPSSNQAQCRLTSLNKANMLTTTLRHHSELPCLEVLVSYCFLCELECLYYRLPYTLGTLPNLKAIVLDGNPMKSIRRDIIMVSLFYFYSLITQNAHFILYFCRCALYYIYILSFIWYSFVHIFYYFSNYLLF